MIVWFGLLCGSVLMAFLAIRIGILAPPHAITLIRLRDGGLQVKRGRMRPDAIGQVAEILSHAGVSNGFIAVTPGNRVTFSRSISSAVRQRLRNVILNQWI